MAKTTTKTATKTTAETTHGYIKLLTVLDTTTIKRDDAEMELFTDLFCELKDTINGHDYKTIKKHIKSTVSEFTVQRQIITILNMAKDYKESKLFTNIMSMRYYNLKDLIALVRYINTHHGKDKVRYIKGRISRLDKKTGNDKVKYNNALHTLIMELRKSYNVVLTTDGEVVTIKNVTAVFKGMTKTQKAQMLKLLLAEDKSNG